MMMMMMLLLLLLLLLMMMVNIMMMMMMMMMIILIGAFVSIFPNQLKAPAGLQAVKPNVQVITLRFPFTAHKTVHLFSCQQSACWIV